MKQRAIDDSILLKKDGDDKPDLVIEAKKLVDSKSKPKKLFLTDYEKNKLNNLQSNIDLPTCSTAGSLGSGGDRRDVPYGYGCRISPIRTNSSNKPNSNNASLRKNLQNDKADNNLSIEAVKGTVKNAQN